MPALPLAHRVLSARSGVSPSPGLILLHGLGSNEEDLFSLAPLLDPRLTVISLRAPSAYASSGYMWWDIEREGPGLGGQGIEHSIDLLRETLAAVPEEYGIDADRIYLVGFSQGAAMSGALALLEPELVAGVILIGGFLPPDTQGRYRTQEAAGLPVFQGHGTADPVVSITYARMTRDFFASTPVNLSYREYPIGHTVSPEELQDLAAWLDVLLTDSD